MSYIFKTDCKAGAGIKFKLTAYKKDWESMSYYFYEEDGDGERKTDTKKLLNLDDCKSVYGGLMEECSITLKEYSENEIAELGLKEKNQQTAAFIFPPGSYGLMRISMEIID